MLWRSTATFPHSHTTFEIGFELPCGRLTRQCAAVALPQAKAQHAALMAAAAAQVVRVLVGLAWAGHMHRNLLVHGQTIWHRRHRWLDDQHVGLILLVKLWLLGLGW